MALSTILCNNKEMLHGFKHGALAGDHNLEVATDVSDNTTILLADEKKFVLSLSDKSDMEDQLWILDETGLHVQGVPA